MSAVITATEYHSSAYRAFVGRRRALWEKQDGLCALCEKPLSWEDAQLDHDHLCCDIPASRACGQCDRGVVHNKCNIRIAVIENRKDDWRVDRYLERYPHDFDRVITELKEAAADVLASSVSKDAMLDLIDELQWSLDYVASLGVG